MKKKNKQDLKIIEWIWPKIENLLNSNWIYSYKDLANSEVDTIKNILYKANKRYTILHNPSSWPKQALIADKWDFEELKIYQDKLIKWIEK
jgi:predicted flap endonuclease-1-like 5' DNA nuclease